MLMNNGGFFFKFGELIVTMNEGRNSAQILIGMQHSSRLPKIIKHAKKSLLSILYLFFVLLQYAMARPDEIVFTHATKENGFSATLINTFIKDHNEEVYPMVQDGWYEPPTGGHFYYGFLLGYSFKKSDIYVKAGKTDAQGLSNNPLGFYGQLGCTFRFNQYQRTGS